MKSRPVDGPSNPVPHQPSKKKRSELTDRTVRVALRTLENIHLSHRLTGQRSLKRSANAAEMTDVFLRAHPVKKSKRP